METTDDGELWWQFLPEGYLERPYSTMWSPSPNEPFTPAVHGLVRQMKSQLIESPAEVEEWCVRHGYTRTSLAFELGITRQTLFNWTRSDGGLPRVLTLSLFALEQLPPEQRSEKGKKMRKKSKRQ